MFDFDDIITILEKVLEETNKEIELSKKNKATKSGENTIKNRPVERKETERKIVEKEQPTYSKLTDRVYCLGENKFKFINSDNTVSYLTFGTEGATITDNQLLVALLYRYRNDVRKYNYVKELLV